MSKKLRIEQYHDIDEYEFSGLTILEAIAYLQKLGEKYPDSIIELESCGYDGLDFGLTYARDETDAEQTSRLKRTAKNKEWYAKQKAEALERKEKTERTELERLTKKYRGQKHA